MANKRKELNVKGANLWYLVGLIASDGCLSKDGRHIDITSKDKGFIVKIKVALGLVNKIGIKNKDKINQAYYLQFSNRNFYEFLLSIGLKPNKSLDLKSLGIPKDGFSDFLRGLIDGDGCVRRWIHPTNLHEQWSLRTYSGSPVFAAWLQSKIEEYLGCRGRLHSTLRPQQRLLYTLKYGKMAAKKILKDCYYLNALSLNRKASLVHACLRATTGWSNSKLVGYPDLIS